MSTHVDMSGEETRAWQPASFIIGSKYYCPCARGKDNFYLPRLFIHKHLKRQSKSKGSECLRYVRAHRALVSSYYLMEKSLNIQLIFKVSTYCSIYLFKDFPTTIPVYILCSAGKLVFLNIPNIDPISQLQKTNKNNKKLSNKN